MHTIGKEVVDFGPLSAVVISFITATLLLSVSIFKGIPTSLVQLNMGAILAIGCAKYGWKEIFSRSSVKKFWLIWVVSPTIAFGLALFLTWIADISGFLMK
jgi:phosphate/sulfate permease